MRREKIARLEDAESELLAARREGALQNEIEEQRIVRANLAKAEKNFLRGPILDVALEHLVLEVLLFQDGLGHVAERDDAEQLSILDDRQVARPAFEHGAAQVD